MEHASRQRFGLQWSKMMFLVDWAAPIAITKRSILVRNRRSFMVRWTDSIQLDVPELFRNLYGAVRR